MNDYPLLNHDYVGVDVSAAYIELAQARVAAFEKEHYLWEREKRLHEVKDTFSEKKRLKKHVGRFAPGSSRKEKHAGALFADEKGR